MSTSGGGGGGKVFVTVITSNQTNITYSHAVTGFTPTNLGTLTGGTGATQFQAALNAAAGDIIQISPGLVVSVPDNYCAFDALIVHSGILVSNNNTTGAATGAGCWYCPTITGDVVVSGSLLYPVAAGDISAGQVTVQLYTFSNTTGTTTVFCNANQPAQFSVINLSALATGA